MRIEGLMTLSTSYTPRYTPDCSKTAGFPPHPQRQRLFVNKAVKKRYNFHSVDIFQVEY